MSKYSYEFKKKLVMEYLNGEAGHDYLTEKYHIGSTATLRRWISAYKGFGDEGLKRSRQQKKYSFEFKKHVVELYLTTEISYQELAIEVGINNPSIVTKWVNDYRIAGFDALCPKRKGRKPQVSKPKKDTVPLTEKEQADAEYLRQLEEENLRLRIENAYLKELRRLRLEDEAKNGKRG